MVLFYFHLRLQKLDSSTQEKFCWCIQSKLWLLLIVNSKSSYRSQETWHCVILSMWNEFFFLISRGDSFVTRDIHIYIYIYIYMYKQQYKMITLWRGLFRLWDPTIWLVVGCLYFPRLIKIFVDASLRI